MLGEKHLGIKNVRKEVKGAKKGRNVMQVYERNVKGNVLNDKMCKTWM